MKILRLSKADAVLARYWQFDVVAEKGKKWKYFKG